MAQECGFFDAKLTGDAFDRVYVADTFASYFASFIGNGIFNLAPVLQVKENYLSPGMSILVTQGRGWINGYWFRNTDVVQLPIDIADGTRNRIDSIVLRWDREQRDMYLTVLKGTVAVTPVAPPPVRDADFYDLVLARVNVSKGLTRIRNRDIIDTRMSNELCGFVTGLIEQVDTTTLFDQFNEYFNDIKNLGDNWLNWSEQTKTDFTKFFNDSRNEFRYFLDNSKIQFNEWFQNLRNQLDSNQAANLQNQIDYLFEAIDNIYDIFYSKKVTQGLTTNDGLLLANNLNEALMLTNYNLQ